MLGSFIQYEEYFENEHGGDDADHGDNDDDDDDKDAGHGDKDDDDLAATPTTL